MTIDYTPTPEQVARARRYLRLQAQRRPCPDCRHDRHQPGALWFFDCDAAVDREGRGCGCPGPVDVFLRVAGLRSRALAMLGDVRVESRVWPERRVARYRWARRHRPLKGWARS